MAARALEILMGAKNFVMELPRWHPSRQQLPLDLLHEADRATEVVVGLRRDALLHGSQIHGADQVVIFTLYIAGLRLPIPDPAQQVGMLAGFLLNILPEGVYSALFAGVQPGDISLMAARQRAG